MREIHIDDENTKVIATIIDSGTLAAIDISSATVMKLAFQRQDKTVFEVDASLLTDGTDGKIEYDTLTGHWNSGGRWKVQGYVIDGLFKNYSKVEEFLVFKNLVVTP